MPDLSPKAAIHSFPAELLSWTFTLAFPLFDVEDPQVSPQEQASAIQQLSLVCSKWRAVEIGLAQSPHLCTKWNNVDL